MKSACHRWLLGALFCGAALCPSSWGQDPAEDAYREASALVSAQDLDGYLAARPQLVTAGVSRARRIYLDLKAAPVNTLSLDRRLELIQSWLGDYTEGDPWRARLVLEAADTARVLRQWDLSNGLLARAEEDLGPQPEEADSLWIPTRAWLHDVRGTLSREMGLFDVAAVELEAQKQWVERTGDVVLHINLLFNRATLAMNRHDGTALREILETAKGPLCDELLPQERQRLDMIAGLCFLEEARRTGKTYDESERHLRRVAEHPDASRYQSQKARLHLAHLRLLQGDYPLAGEELTRFAEATPDELADGPQFELDLHYAGLVGWLAADQESEDRGDSRARSALERVETQLDRLLETWAEAPLNPSGIGYRSYYESKLLIDGALRLRGRLNGHGVGSRETLSLLLRLQSYGTLVRSLGLPAPTLNEVEAALLREGHGLLIIQPGYERSWVLAIDQQGIQGGEVLPEYRLEALVQGLQSAVLAAVANRVPSSQELEESVAAVTAAILPQEIQERLTTWNSVAVVGSESLGWLPFELLRGPSGDELGTTHGVSYLPSLPLGVHLARPRQAPVAGAAPAFLLAAGTGVSDTALARWRVADLSQQEGKIGLLSRAYGPSATALIGQQLTGPRLRESLEGSRVAQVVAHGIYGTDRVRPSGLLLASDDAGQEELWTEDLEDWQWPELVLLSSCGVHRGPLRRGDDGRSLLAGSVLAGGARAVLLPYVDLDLQDHLELAHAFHERLIHSGDAPEEALRQARASCTGLERYLVHLVGVGHAPLVANPLPANTRRSLGWLGAGALSLLFAALLLRRAVRARRSRPRLQS